MNRCMRSSATWAVVGVFAMGMILAAGPSEAPQDDSKVKKVSQKPKAPKAKGKKRVAKMPALAFTMKDIDGKDVKLSKYYGKVVLMVNTASKCGYTPQYKGLETIYEKYKDQGFIILGFPANDFGAQEPGTNEEIKTFCTEKYSVTFPMFAKVCVKGDKKCDLYKYLTSKTAGHKYGGEIPWNFNKFLVSRKGTIVDRFEHKVPPEAPSILKAIEKALNAKVPADVPKPKKKSPRKKKSAT